MDYLFAAQTDIGISKRTNQDSFSIKKAQSKKYGNILFAIVCDGMGGLSKGELASATVLKEFNIWFESYFPTFLQNNTINYHTIKNEWTALVRKLNSKIGNYGLERGFSLGTTLVCALCVGKKLYVANVGDSRLYKFNNEKVTRLTTDQSLVAREIASGAIPPEAEETDSRRNVLLQCIGASQVVEPEIDEYDLDANAVYLLCSDGFRHEIKESELLGLLSPGIVADEKMLDKTLLDIIKLLKERRENDNITAVSFKTV